MCELFAVSSEKEVEVNSYLLEFMSHGIHHPNGWGLATFYGDSVSLEKEPTPSYKSVYLKERLKHRLMVKEMIGHIRLATKGIEAYENTHPFVKRDGLDRAWTLAHNGTIFHGDILDRYIYSQSGSSDSERILCFVRDRINDIKDASKRFEIVDDIVYQLSDRNKLNLIIRDDKYLYVHTNYKNSLYQKDIGIGKIFATVPLDRGEWSPVPFCQLLVFKKGKCVYEGKNRTHEYIDNPEDMKYIFLDSAGL